MHLFKKNIILYTLESTGALKWICFNQIKVWASCADLLGGGERTSVYWQCDFPFVPVETMWI